MEAVINFLKTTGVYQLFWDVEADKFNTSCWQYLVMYVIIGALFYLAIVKKFEPLLLMPIAFGMLLANLPGANLIHLDFFFDEYYIAVENGQFTGTMALQVQNFVQNGLGYSDFFTLTNDSFKVNMDVLQSVGIDASYVQSVFESFVSGATLDTDGYIHVKMATVVSEVINNGGLVDILYLGVKLGVYPSLIFMGVGAMTDFSPLIANTPS